MSKSSKTPLSGSALSSRRTFLRSTSAAMVGGLASPLAIPDYADEATFATGSCEFSSLPPGFAAMLTAMKFIEDSGGAAQVEKHILDLAQQVKNVILSRSPGNIISPHADSELQSGLNAFFPFKWDRPEVSYQDKKTADWVVQELMKKNIQVRSIGFANSDSSDQGSDTAYAIRVSTAYFNSADDIDRFSMALQEVLKQLS